MGIGLGKVLLNMVDPGIRTIVLAGHGPAECREVDRFLDRYPEAHITAFEPQKDLFKGCKIKYYGNPRVTMRSEALGLYEGEISLNVAKDDGWSSTRPVRSEKLDVRDQYMVQLTTLDALGISHIDLLYLDVQGAEEDVLLGGVNLLRNQDVDIIVGESVFTDLYGDRHSFHDVYSLLAIKCGYTFVGWYVPCYNDWGRVNYCDYVFATPEIVSSVEEQHAAS